MTRPFGSERRIRLYSPADEGAFAGRADLPADLIGTGHMRIARDGTWYHEGGPIKRPKLVKLFASVLRREDDGTYWLVTPVERCRVHVDDAPFTAQELVREGAGRSQVLYFRTNLDAWIAAGGDHPIHMAISPSSGEPAPYIRVKEGLDALIVRQVFYELADLAIRADSDAADPQNADREATPGVWSQETFFPLIPNA